MRMIVHNNWATVIGYAKELKDVCSYTYPGARFTKAYEKGWDGRISLIKNGKIPSGLVGDVLKVIDDAEIIDKRLKPPGNPSLVWKGDVLRDYQKVEDIIKKGRGIIAYPCGSGKSIIFAKILADLNLPALVVVPSRDLLTQTKEVLKQCLGQEIGEVSGSKQEQRKFTVMTIQKLNSLNFTSNLEHLVDVDVLIVDEIHHTVGLDKWFWRLLEVRAFYRYGFTATPYRSRKVENVLLKAVTGNIIAHIGTKKLEKKGYLVPARLKIVEVNGRGIGFDGDWSKLYEQGIVYNAERNQKVSEEALAYLKKGKQVMVLVERIGHGIALGSLCKLNFLYGDTPKEEREEKLNLFRQGKLKGLIASRIFSEGIDIPNLDVLIIASGGNSDVKAVQRMGRVLRPFPGKEKAIIVDFLDNHNFLLARHSEKRFQTYRKVLDIKEGTDLLDMIKEG